MFVPAFLGSTFSVSLVPDGAIDEHSSLVGYSEHRWTKQNIIQHNVT